MARPFTNNEPEDFLRGLVTRVNRLERQRSGIPPVLTQAVTDIYSTRLESALPVTTGAVLVGDEQPPMDLPLGTIWRDTSLQPSIDRILTEDGWDKIEDPALLEAIEPFNSSVEILKDPTMPTGDQYLYGSLWRDPVQGILYRWDGTQWRDTTIGDLGPLTGVQDWIADSGAQLETLLGGPDVIPQSVIDHLWANVVRANDVTTDMLRVGAGNNLLVDPYFLNAEVNAFRLAYSAGSWSIAQRGALNWMLATVQDSVGLTVAASLQNGDTAETAHAAVTPGHHYRLRAKVQQTDASVATVVPLVWYNTASGAVDVPGTLVDPTPKAVPLTAEWAEWEWVAPDDAIAVRMSMEFTVTAGPLGTIGLAAPGIFSMTDGSLVVDGSIIAREVLTADPGGPLVHVFDGAVNVYGPERVDEDGQPIRDVWLNMGNDDAGGGNFGPGDNLWRAPDPTDPELASSSINKQGDAEFLSVSARDDMFIGGESVKAALTEAVQPALLVMDSRYQTQVRGPYSTRTGVWRWGMSAKAGHRYTTMFTFRIDTTADWFDATIHKNESAPGTTPTQPSVSSPAMQTKRIIHGNGTQAFYYNVEYSFNPGFDEETAWLLSINTTSASSNPWTIREFVVRMTDWGVGPDNTGYATTGGAAETPPTRWMDKYFYFDRHRTWSNNGRLTDGRWNPWWVRTGLGGSSLYRGYLLLSSADRAKIMASDEVPSSIGLELDVASGWGGKPYLGTHNSSSVDTAEPSYANRAYTSNSAPASAGAVTFYLNAQQRTNLHNGHWGIYLGPQSGSKIIDFKGTNDPQSPSGAYSSTVVPRIKVRGKWAN